MIVLSLPRKHVEIEHPERLARSRVGNGVELEIVDPFLRNGDFLKLQAKDALVDVEHPFERFLEREIYS